MKKIIGILTAILFSVLIGFPTHSEAGGKGWGGSFRSPSIKGYYKSTGIPKAKRSKSAKEKFLKSRGYKKVPPGYEIDHIVPLHRGGVDEPYNMQLLPKELHHQKSSGER